MDRNFWYALTLGIFFSNWLVVPAIVKLAPQLALGPARTFTDGFCIGVIAALLMLAIGRLIVRR